MIDITLENFETDLVGASLQVPVLLDIWAPWCGPCKTLGPVLEKLEADMGGRFLLAKLDADAQPEIAQQLSQMFGVRSIPFCVLFKQGQPVDGFVGALPEAQIREFLAKHLPGDDALASEAETREAEAQAESGQAPSAYDKLLDTLQKDPANDEARFDLIKLLLAENLPAATHQATEVFAPVAARGAGPVPEARVAAFARYIHAAQAAEGARPVEVLEQAIAADRRDFAARFELAQWHFGQGRFTEAMDALLEILMRDKTWNDDLARKTYVAILEVLTVPVPRPAPAAGRPGPGQGGPGAPGTGAQGAPKLEVAGHVAVASANPVIDQYRRRLSSTLF